MALTAIGFLAAHAAALLALLASALVAGLLVWRPTLGLAGAVLACGLGLVVLATLGCGLGLAGQLRLAPLLVVVVGIHLLGLGKWRELAAARHRLAVLGPHSPARRILAASGAAVAIGLLLVLAMYPPTAFDETLYHLPTARAFAAAGSLSFLPELRFPVFPHFAEVLAAEVLLFAGDTDAHLVQLLAVLLTTMLLWAWGREWGGADRPAAGWLAAAAWLGNPLVSYLSGTGYVEPLLALFVTSATYGFWNWRRNRQRRWLALAAVFAGAAASTKYLGLFFVVALALAVAASRSVPSPASQVPRGGRARDVSVFVAVALCAMAPWYGRILALTGNPVFPYLSGLFGQNAWTPVHFRTLTLGPHTSDWALGLGHGMLRLITLPWDVVARRNLVGGLPPLSPFYLIAAPWVIAAALRERPLRRLLGLAIAFLLFFPALPADARYLVTVLPMFSLGLGLAVSAALRRWGWGRKPGVAVALGLLLAMPGSLYASYRIALQGPPPVTPGGREAYLSHRVPLYPAVARVNQLLRSGETVYGLNAENMRDYVRGNFFGDFYGAHRFALLQDALAEPKALHATLQAWGVDYFLVAKPRAKSPGLGDLEGAGFALLFEDKAALLYALRPRSEGEVR